MHKLSIVTLYFSTWFSSFLRLRSSFLRRSLLQENTTKTLIEQEKDQVILPNNTHLKRSSMAGSLKSVSEFNAIDFDYDSDEEETAKTPTGKQDQQNKSRSGVSKAVAQAPSPTTAPVSPTPSNKPLPAWKQRKSRKTETRGENSRVDNATRFSITVIAH